MHIAQKTNPSLWREAKRRACSKGNLCKHSARKMQWATRYYKAHGGGHAGPQSSRNSLRRWGKQRWRTPSGKPSRGKRRYLPEKAWQNLSKRDIRRTNASKRRGFARGKQWVAQPKDVAVKTRRYRRSASRKSTRRKSTRRTHAARARAAIAHAAIAHAARARAAIAHAARARAARARAARARAAIAHAARARAAIAHAARARAARRSTIQTPDRLCLAWNPTKL